MSVGVLLLAAGEGRRFGCDKRRAALADGRTLLDATIDAIGPSGLPLRVCVGARDRGLGAELESRGLAVVYCSNAEQGMGATLAQGVATVDDWSGVLVALADMPLVGPETYRLLAGKLAPDAICVPTWGGTRGNPVGFGADYYSALRQMRGDRGARIVVEGDPGAVREVPVQDPGVLTDVDTRADLSALVEVKTRRR